VTIAPPRQAIDLVYADIGSFDESAHAGLIAAEDLAALGASTLPRRRAEHLAGRALLRFALERRTGRPALAHRLRMGANGKPECADGPPFSVSHSGKLVVCALAPRGRIGVDVELPRRPRDVRSIAARYFSAEESRWVGAEPRRFFMLWVLKEAYLKALGVGLSGGLDALRCSIERTRIDAVARDGERPALALYEVADGFLALAALGCELGEVAAEQWSSGTPRSAPLRLVASTR
jgi:4'-phosphopantetheinyl transferase